VPFRRSGLSLGDIQRARRSDFADLLFPNTKRSTPPHRNGRLLARLPSVHSRIEHDGLSVLDAWREEVTSKQCDHKYSNFASLYAAWRFECGLQARSRAKKTSVSIKPTDYKVFNSWQRSHDRRKWEVSIALLGLSTGQSISELCRKIGRSQRTVEKWCLTYQNVGIDGLPPKRSRRLSKQTEQAIVEKKDRLIKVIHQAPNAYGINRASWSLQALSDAYEKVYGERASRSSISEYFIGAGYKFKKAKKSLTSNDPAYREKLTKITATLSNLASDEKFFSIDEFGPFSVKICGGVTLVPGDTITIIPQRQRSKGSLICTADLELSSNQITHFYSKKKNSKEMIKLLR
jgi:transposase